MKLKTIILLGSLIVAQIVAIPIYAFSSVMSITEVQRRMHDVNLSNKYENHHRRSALPVATGYIEDDVLYLSFSLPLSNAHIRVVESETGKTVFEGLVSGASCSITLERDSESFEIYY